MSTVLPTDDAQRKALPMWTFLLEYFPKAFLEVVKVAVAGNEQHNKGQPLHWARGKSKDQMNTAFRHMFDHGLGATRDTDGCYHLAKAIWRLSAELELQIEKDAALNTKSTTLLGITGAGLGSHCAGDWCDGRCGADPIEPGVFDAANCLWARLGSARPMTPEEARAAGIVL